MAYCKLITYKEALITYTNIENSTMDEACEAFIESRTVVGKQAPGRVLSMVNATGARFNSKLLSTIKETVRVNNGKVRMTAVFGLSSLTTLIVKSIIHATGREIRLFDTEEEAKEFLYEVAQKQERQSA